MKADVNAKREAAAEQKSGGTENEISKMITAGLGGKKNISDVDCCATRLRCTVLNSDLVNDSLLRSTGASGVVHKGKGVQIIYGPKVTVIKSDLEDYLETAPDEEVISAASVENEKTDKTKESRSSEKIAASIVISSPVTGMAADLSATPDEAFAGKMMGDGATVTPKEPVVYAPEDGEVCFVFDTKHAIGFLTDTGISLLLHIGIDTVKLDGRGFEALVENGQKVKKGEPMLKLDIDFIEKNAPSLISPILCTELESNQKIRLLAEGKIQAGEPLFAVDIYEE